MSKIYDKIKIKEINSKQIKNIKHGQKKNSKNRLPSFQHPISFQWPIHGAPTQRGVTHGLMIG